MTSRNTKKKKVSIFIKAPVLLVVFLVFGYLGSLVIEYTGILFGFWEIDHTQKMILKEVSYINAFDENELPGIPTPTKTALSFLTFINSNDLSYSAIYTSLIGRGYSESTSNLLAIPFGVIALFGIRLIICLYSLLMFTVFTVVAIQEGFLSRHLRKLGGGEESSFKYHFLKRNLKPAFVTGWTIYLLSPLSYHPNIILVPMGLIFSYVLYATIANWKKIT